MNLFKVARLEQIKEKYQPVKTKSERVIDKGQDIIYKGRMMDYEPDTLSEHLSSATQVRGMIKVGHGLLIEYMMYRKIKKELISRGLYTEEEIAMNIDELNAANGRTKVFLGDLDYRANINKNALTNLEVVFGNASFLALNREHSTEENISRYIKNLNVVMGDLSLNDLTCPIDLVAVFGSANLVNVEDMSNLPNLVLVKEDLKLNGLLYPSSLSEVGNDVIVEGEVDTDEHAFDGIESFSGYVTFKKSNKSFSRRGKTYINK